MARRRERLKGRDLGPQGPLALALETGGDHLGVALWRLAEEARGQGEKRLLEEVTQHRGHRPADSKRAGYRPPPTADLCVPARRRLGE